MEIVHHLEAVGKEEAEEVQRRNQVNIGISDTPVSVLSIDVEQMGYLGIDTGEQAGWEIMVNMVRLRST